MSIVHEPQPSNHGANLIDTNQDQGNRTPTKNNKKALRYGGAALGLAGVITAGVLAFRPGQGSEGNGTPEGTSSSDSAAPAEPLSPEQQARAEMQAQVDADLELARVESTMTPEQLVDQFEIPAAEFPTAEAFAGEFISRLDHWINAGGTEIELPLDADRATQDVLAAELTAKYDKAMIQALFGSYATEGTNPSAIEDITQQYHAMVIDNVTKTATNDFFTFRGTIDYQLIAAVQDGNTARTELTVRYTDNGDQNTVGRYRQEQGQPVVYDVDMGLMSLDGVIDADGNWKVTNFGPSA